MLCHFKRNISKNCASISLFLVKTVAPFKFAEKSRNLPLRLLRYVRMSFALLELNANPNRGVIILERIQTSMGFCSVFPQDNSVRINTPVCRNTNIGQKVKRNTLTHIHSWVVTLSYWV